MTNRPKILVTRRWPDAVESRLAENFDVEFNRADRALTAAELREAVSAYDAVLPTVTDRIGPDTLDVARPRARLLANYGAGISHIDLGAVRARGLTLTNTPDVLSECTADLAMTLMLMVARRAAEGQAELMAGQWGGWRPTHMLGTKVSGKTLGLIGFGRIAREVARRAHHGFGMRVLVFNRSPVPAADLAAFGARQVASLEALLPQCDFVSVHVPGGDGTRAMIGARELNWMRPDAFLVNTARGEVIDERALAQALWFETIGGAALDVFEGEPRINPELRDCDRLVMLPHLGSATRESREAMGLRVLENVTAFFEGREPRDRVAV